MNAHIEAETLFVGAIMRGFMQDDRELVTRALSDVTHEHFIDPKFRKLIEVLKEATAQGNFDVVGIALKHNIDTERLYNAVNATFTAQYAQEYGLTVKENWLARSIQPTIDRCTAQGGLQRLMELQKSLDELETKVILNPRDTSHEKLVDYIDNKREPYKVGISGIDKWTGGFEPGDVVVIAGRPGTGKTALMLSMAVSAVRYQHHPIDVYSYEMEDYKLRRRLVAMDTNIPIHVIRRRDFGIGEPERIKKSSENLTLYPLKLLSFAGRTLDNLVASIMASEARIVFVDYLQLIRLGRKSAGRYDTVSEVSTTLMQCAKSTQKVIIGLSQLNREIDKQNRKPVLSDLRESGALEQDADIVILLHRPEQPSSDTEDITLIGAKFREGRQLEHTMKFNKSVSRFYDQAEQDNVF